MRYLFFEVYEGKDESTSSTYFSFIAGPFDPKLDIGELHSVAGFFKSGFERNVENLNIKTVTPLNVHVTEFERPSFGANSPSPDTERKLGVGLENWARKYHLIAA